MGHAGKGDEEELGEVEGEEGQQRVHLAMVFDLKIDPDWLH
jgi:hypothetical protein